MEYVTANNPDSDDITTCHHMLSIMRKASGAHVEATVTSRNTWRETSDGTTARNKDRIQINARHHITA